MASSLRAVFRQEADLVILDLDRDGGTADVLTRIRRRSTVPVIVCSSQASEQDRVRLLNLGADDFVDKPYSMPELEARVRAVMRRGSAAPTTTLDLGGLVIDHGTRTVTLGGDEITMTRKEFDLLAFLATSPGRVFSREELLERVWGSTSRWQGCSTVTEHVRRVRLKIETDPESPRWITTVRGIGYRFTSAAAA
jgi:two-component system response regulator ResD